MQPLSGNQHPHLLTSLMNMSLVLRLPRKMHLCRSSSNVPRMPSFLQLLQHPNVLLIFGKVHNPLRLPRETSSERPKVARTCGVLYILTSTCASRRNSEPVSFLNFWLRNVLRATTACTFSTSQLPTVLWTRQLFTLLTPQRRALFRHLNFQKCHEPSSFLHFWLRNVLRATTACTFSTFFDISTSKGAPRLRCFVHFDLELYFVPQRRALFRHRNF